MREGWERLNQASHLSSLPNLVLRSCRYSYMLSASNSNHCPCCATELKTHAGRLMPTNLLIYKVNRALLAIHSCDIKGYGSSISHLTSCGGKRQKKAQLAASKRLIMLHSA